MPSFLTVPKPLHEEMVGWCLKGLPNEACGILAGLDGHVSAFFPVKNVEPSPASYLMDSADQFRIMKEIRGNGLKMLAVFHSHPASPPRPSATDVGLAFYDDIFYLIIGLMEGTPEVGCFRIFDGRYEEVELVITGGSA